MAQFVGVKKKTFILEEAAAPDTAKKPAKGKAGAKAETTGVRRMDEATFKKSADKVFKTHSELFRKLAQ